MLGKSFYRISLLLLLLTLASGKITNAEIALPEMGDSAGALVSPIEEYRVGQSFFWQMQQAVDLVEDPEINSYITSLGFRLAHNSDDPGRPFKFFMVPDSSINAFAAPGGFIGIHSGLMLAAEREDELASVVAHEIAHVTQRHLLRRYERQQQMSMPLTAAMLAAALLGAYDPNIGSAAIMAVQGGAIQLQLDYSRAHEAEADNLGMQMLVRSGFDPHAMPAFFEKLQFAGRFYGGSTVPEFLRTHPVTTARIADARGRAAHLQKVPTFRDELQFYLMREKLRVLTTSNLNELIQQYQHTLDTTDGDVTPTQYGFAMALLAQGDTGRAREMLKPLLDADDDRLTYHLAMADIEMAVGRPNAALAIYEDNQSLYPDHYALSIQHVRALLQTRQPGKAVNILQRQLEMGSPSRVIYRLLAQAHGDMGQGSASHSALAEYYYSSGQLHAAVDQLRLAAEQARGDEFQLSRLTARIRSIETEIALMERR